jgi:hypothetical protein
MCPSSKEPNPVGLRLSYLPPARAFSYRRPFVRLFLILFALVAQASPPASTDLDRFMARALQRRDVDRQTVSDYILDEVEVFEVLGPGRIPFARMRREYTSVKSGRHPRAQPAQVRRCPDPGSRPAGTKNSGSRAKEAARDYRTKRDEKREQEGTGPALSAPSINEPRFISESWRHGLQVRAGQLLPCRQGNPRRQGKC